MQSPAARLESKPELDRTIAACQRGDRGAFRLLFEAFRQRVYGNARHILGNEAAAKDATQCVFVRVWKALPGFDPSGDFSSWLYRITLNTCLTERARLRRHASAAPLEDVHASAGGSSATERAVYARQVQLALAQVSPAFAEVLVLRHVDGLSYDEIAEVLGCSPGTVASRLNRAHEAMARAFGEERA